MLDELECFHRATQVHGCRNWYCQDGEKHQCALNTVCPRYGEESTKEGIEYDDTGGDEEGYGVIKTKYGIEQFAPCHKAR